MRLHLLVFLGVIGFIFFLGSARFAMADPSQPPLGVPTIPPALQNNPYVQSLINSLGGLLQSTNGGHAQGKIIYVKRFEVQVETAPRVYREIHLHQGTVINPRGATLTRGVMVEVNGIPQSDGSLNADVVTMR
jgi:hypothetical protein